MPSGDALQNLEPSGLTGKIFKARDLLFSFQRPEEFALLRSSQDGTLRLWNARSDVTCGLWKRAIEWSLLRTMGLQECEEAKKNARGPGRVRS